MEAEIKTAWIVAGVKIGLGFLFVAAIVGIRMVSVSPVSGDARDSDVIVSDRPASEATATPFALSGSAARDSERGRPDESGSLIDRMTSGVRDRMPGSPAERPREGDRMVSCRLGGATQFMRADDCAMRGGRAQAIGR